MNLILEYIKKIIISVKSVKNILKRRIIWKPMKLPARIKKEVNDLKDQKLQTINYENIWSLPRTRFQHLRASSLRHICSSSKGHTYSYPPGQLSVMKVLYLSGFPWAWDAAPSQPNLAKLVNLTWIIMFFHSFKFLQDIIFKYLYR